MRVEQSRHIVSLWHSLMRIVETPPFTFTFKYHLFTCYSRQRAVATCNGSNRTTHIRVGSRRNALKVSSQTLWALFASLHPSPQSWVMGRCHGYSFARRAYARPLGPMCRKYRRPEIWQREVTQEEVAWRLARASGRDGILDMSSLGLAQMQPISESKDSLDGRLE